MRLAGKKILVTGSTTGIGEAIARHCVKEGAQVTLHGREEARAKKIISELGSNAHYLISDLENTEANRQLVYNAAEAMSGLDALVNNAGIYPRNTIDTLDEKFFDQVVNVNMKAPLFLSKYAIEIFRKQKRGGNILNIGSLNAYCGQKDLLVYSMTKGGLMTMTRNLGDALGREKIRVNLLNVGWVVTETELALKKREGFSEDWETKVPPIFAPWGRLLRPDDVARHAVFWVSDESAPANAIVYELEEYPMIGRNLITEIMV